MAAAFHGDPAHEKCRALFARHPRPYVVPVLVIAEVAYLIERALGPRAESGFLSELVANDLQIEQMVPADLLRMAELVDTYADLPLGSVDASVIATAERLQATQVATLDRRHFTVVRPVHTPAFHLLP